MSRIKCCFDELRGRRRKALVPFITAGDPDPKLTVLLMHTLVQAGADIIELGVPFSDPMADGPVIQRASERALKHGVCLTDVIGMVQAFRTTNAQTPVVLMGYLNPVEILGYERFAQTAQAAGVDGVLTVDLPPEEADDFLSALRAHGLDPIFLLAPTTSDERLARICRSAAGFVYYVSLKGVTGSDKLDVDSIAERLQSIRRHTSLPVGVGFGIKDSETAARVAAISDAVVVGSALVSRMEATAADPARLNDEVKFFIAEIRLAMDSA
jgi:tryptophan synthase alpha chain